MRKIIKGCLIVIIVGISALAMVIAIGAVVGPSPKKQQSNEYPAPEKQLSRATSSPAPTPKTMKEAKAVFASKDGMHLVGAPKIKPDGVMYHVYGYIDRPDGSLQFIARLNEDKYFMVRVPASFQKAYGNSQIGSLIGIIGRYTENMGYKTVSGQVGYLPVFDAIYFELNPKTPMDEQIDAWANQREKEQILRQREREQNERNQAIEQSATPEFKKYPVGIDNI